MDSAGRVQLHRSDALFLLQPDTAPPATTLSGKELKKLGCVESEREGKAYSTYLAI